MKNPKQGFVALYFALLVMLVLSGIGASVFLLTLGQQRIIQNTRESLQAYYGAEAGVEDALIRLVNKQNSCDPPGSPPCSNSLGVGNASTTIEISKAVGGARTITSKGDSSNRVRTVRVVHQLTSEDVAFNFGAHVGNPSLAGGGLEMVQCRLVSGRARCSPGDGRYVAGFSNVRLPLEKTCPLSGGHATRPDLADA